MHLVEQCGQALHFIHHHPITRLAVGDGLGEQRGIGKQILMETLIKQVQEGRFGEHGPSPTALAHAAHAKQEKAALRRADQALIVANHVVIFP
ncbi:MAG: hypothetical protein OXF68_06020 [Gammaproteobacteria bacterium]|nr:hypothetical protein [Gammaproteobacteria bacterium]